MFSPFEIIMLICFGAGWPLAVVRTWRVKNSAGKSLSFLFLVLIGYISGMLHKIYYSPDRVIILYAVNATMVGTDLVLSWWYRPRRHNPVRLALPGRGLFKKKSGS